MLVFSGVISPSQRVQNQGSFSECPSEHMACTHTFHLEELKVCVLFF